MHAKHRTCARHGCKQQFKVDTRKADQRYCSRTCKNIARDARRGPRHEGFRSGCRQPWKLKHASEADAVKAMQDSIALGYDESQGLNVYPCPGDHWHVGRRFRQKRSKKS